MPIRKITSADTIEIKTVRVMYYGGPSAGKSTLAQTAEAPCTLDLDAGIHRATNRRDAFQFDTWQDVIQFGRDGNFKPYKTIIVDTGGRALDMLTPHVLEESAKNGTRGGNLSPQGWGVLGTTFVNWMKVVCGWGKDVVIVCHETVKENAAGVPYSRPDLQGNLAWNELHKSCDIMGHIRYEGEKRFLDFRPNESQTAKDGGRLGSVPMGDLHQDHDFLARLIRMAKANMGKSAEAEAEVLRAVNAWRERLKDGLPVEQLNADLDELKEFPVQTRNQVRALIKEYTTQQGWQWDEKAKGFYAPAGDAAESEVA